MALIAAILMFCRSEFSPMMKTVFQPQRRGDGAAAAEVSRRRAEQA
jgi:hypothetical protein